MVDMDTEYRPIPSAPGYLAGADGSIIGKQGRILKQAKTPNGYLCYRASQPGFTPVTRSSHVAICEAFHGLRPEGTQVAHNNGIRSDNRAENLRWSTAQDNMTDKIDHGTHNGGEGHYNAKLSDRDVRMIRGDTTSSHAELGRKYGVSSSHIYNIRIGLKRRGASNA